MGWHAPCLFPHALLRPRKQQQTNTKATTSPYLHISKQRSRNRSNKMNNSFKACEFCNTRQRIMRGEGVCWLVSQSLLLLPSGQQNHCNMSTRFIAIHMPQMNRHTCMCTCVQFGSHLKVLACYLITKHNLCNVVDISSQTVSPLDKKSITLSYFGRNVKSTNFTHGKSSAMIKY